MHLARKARSTGVIIILGGKILAERYWDLSKDTRGSGAVEKQT
jgi:hypothetical protein